MISEDESPAQSQYPSDTGKIEKLKPSQVTLLDKESDQIEEKTVARKSITPKPQLDLAEECLGSKRANPFNTLNSPVESSMNKRRKYDDVERLHVEYVRSHEDAEMRRSMWLSALEEVPWIRDPIEKDLNKPTE